MKKNITIILIILSILIFILYLVKDYTIEYKVDKIKITEKYYKKRYIFTLDNKYLMDIYSNKKFNKKLIKNIKKVKDGNYECLILKSSKLTVYPLCRKDDKQISYDLVESKKLSKYFNKSKILEENDDKSFEFFNNVENETYISIWKYNGFYIMNGTEITTLNIFGEDRYSNDLCVNSNKYIFLPDYDSKHTFNYFYKVDVTKKNFTKIKTGYEIDYDSYILGSHDEFIYLYDRKYKTEYEFNLKKDKLKIIGNKENGFIKYKNGKIEKTSWNKLDKKMVHFTFNKESNYSYKNNKKEFIKIFSDNKKLINIIYKKPVTYIDEYKDKVYFLDKEYLIEFSPIYGSKKVVRNFEWNFNKDNTIFIYNK